MMSADSNWHTCKSRLEILNADYKVIAKNYTKLESLVKTVFHCCPKRF